MKSRYRDRQLAMNRFFFQSRPPFRKDGLRSAISNAVNRSQSKIVHLFLFLLGGSFCLFAEQAPADVIRLKSGGEVRGELSEAQAEESAPVSIRSLSGAQILIHRDDIDFVERRSAVLEEYETRVRELDGSIEAHWQLAEWSRSHLLNEKREEQLLAIVSIDPEHAEARRILGHQKHRGQWMTEDEVMSDRGYVKYQNKWMTPQELALIKTDVKQREAEIQWYPKIRVWLSWLTGSDPQRQRKSLELFAEITDPDSIPALRKMMEPDENTNVRLLYVDVLGQIAGSSAIPALVDRYLFDDYEPVRRAAMDVIFNSRSEAAVSLLISALRHQSNLIVRRAARGLETIGDTSAVPALIDALVTTHRVTYSKTEVAGNGFSMSGGQVSFSNGNPYSTWSPELYAAAITGQVNVEPSPYLPRTTRTFAVSVPVKNADVLAALETLTGRNLGFNERDWYVWWSVHKS
ncbi:PBS lyase HEAT-like repeat protein [Thalassoglobus neptunius]|uniref:PBS lyase HEAT-like repeat protein n=2 Tax=Thalassoglobus neptunius TaxID=1938619 RepID=A0A5C5X401_9PLAN|nr:PBS lyase HEAT-like repeat protein [Thalassoglobus neptunius]